MDPEALRADIPAVEETAYMNTGASGPSPRHVVDAATEFLERHEYEAHAAGEPYGLAWNTYEDVRERIADFIGTDAPNVALTNSTADGLSRLAASVDWEPGDVAVYTDLEHPAGVLPWERAADVVGIETRVLETERGRVDFDALNDAVADARVLCLSALSWNYGTTIPIERVVEAAHDHDTRVVVDAVQSPGQQPMPVEDWGADAVAAASHKWLLGIWGAGFLYVSDEFADALEPPRTSYRGVAEAGGSDYELHAGARQLEIGTTSLAPHVAATTAMDTIEAIGLDTVQARIERLTDRLKNGLGDRLLSPREYESGLVTFAADDPDALVDRLGEAGIVVRSIPDPESVRASIHVFNTAADVDRLLDAL
jgi:selenocysteine lyase/cysteine desulfurase